MRVEIDEIGVEKIQGLEFFVANSLDGWKEAFFAALDENRDRWLVLESDFNRIRDGYVEVFTTDEMKLMFRSLLNEGDGTMKAPSHTAYRHLLRAGKLPMQVDDGCTGCGILWKDLESYGRCKKCSRCYICCGKKDVTDSCAANRSLVNAG